MGRDIVTKKPSELLAVGSVLKQHANAVMYETMADTFKLEAILHRGRLYSEFDGSQRECGEYFGVSNTVIADYSILYDNRNLVLSTEEQEISKNKLLAMVRQHKAEEKEEVEDFKLTFDDVLGNMDKSTDKTKEAINDLIVDANNESTLVKVALLQKGGGLKTAQRVIGSDLSDDDKIKCLKMSKKKLDEFMIKDEEDEPYYDEDKETKNEEAKQRKDEREVNDEANEELIAENIKLKSKIREFTKKESGLNQMLRRMESIVGSLNLRLKDYEKELHQRKRVVPASLITELEEAYLVLGFLTTDKPTKREVKKAFEKLGKLHHPDIGGDKEVMQALNAAYTTIKNMMRGK